MDAEELEEGDIDREKAVYLVCPTPSRMHLPIRLTRTLGTEPEKLWPLKCCEVFLERHSAPAGEGHGEVHFGIAMKASGSFRFMPSMSACMYVCMLACTHACVCIGIVATGFAEVLSTVDGQNLAPLSVGGTCTLALPF